VELARAVNAREPHLLIDVTGFSGDHRVKARPAPRAPQTNSRIAATDLRSAATPRAPPPAPRPLRPAAAPSGRRARRA